jgi:hypothetical protein
MAKYGPFAHLVSTASALRQVVHIPRPRHGRKMAYPSAIAVSGLSLRRRLLSLIRVSRDRETDPHRISKWPSPPVSRRPQTPTIGAGRIAACAELRVRRLRIGTLAVVAVRGPSARFTLSARRRGWTARWNHEGTSAPTCAQSSAGVPGQNPRQGPAGLKGSGRARAGSRPRN